MHGAATGAWYGRPDTGENGLGDARGTRKGPVRERLQLAKHIFVTGGVA